MPYKNRKIGGVDMKGPNPFVMYEENSTNLCGRKEEGRIFNSFMNATSSKQSGAMMVFGGPGVGKTTMLRHFTHLAEREGLLVLFVKVEKGENMAAVVDKIYHESGMQIKGASLDTFGDLAKSIKLDKKHFGTIFLIDDIDKMKKAKEAILAVNNVVKSLWKKKPVSFVMSSTKEFVISSELFKTIVLKPFEEHDGRELVEKALKKGPPKMGDECFHSIMNDTLGNPRLFKTVCHHIYERLKDNEKIISKGHYLAYLPYIMSMLSREWFGRMYQETPAAEKEILLILAKRDSAHVSDIARELDKPLGPITALIKRLLDRGQIVKLDRGKYRIFSKIYGKYVIQRS
jgi:mRNA-degrading endonuclease RelE of RelBE toxin-antitoxin system